MRDSKFLFTGIDLKDNWLFEKYYYNGTNTRYWTFHLALNILHQTVDNPVIIETGCQRQEEDLGGGMSTSLFAEYIDKYGGKLISVDIEAFHLRRAQSYLLKWPNINVQLIHSDSVDALCDYEGECDLLYLDSYDYPIGEIWNIYGGKEDLPKAMEELNKLTREEIIEKYKDIILPCQEHCLREFQAIETHLHSGSLLLVDDNTLNGGGKPRLLKDYLLKDDTWVCLLDHQQSCWIKR